MNFNVPLIDFEKRYKKENIARAKTRLHILLLRRQNYTQKEISAIACVTQGTVSNVCRRFLKNGWSSVYDKPREGRPSRLTREQKALLRHRMQKEIVDGDVRRGWQTKDVVSMLREEFGVRYTQRNVRFLLHDFGMSWKVPRPEHKNRDEKAVMSFKKSSRGRPCRWQMNTLSFA